MQSPRVSIVIPAFNGLPFLQQAYESVRSQTYPNVEICISDGGSTDGTEAWIKTLPSDVRRETLPPGTSPGANWTAATEMATGEYIKLMCQDDLLYPTAIADQVQDLQSHPEALAAVAQRDVISASGKVLYKKRGLAGLPSGLVSGQAILQATYLSGTNILGEPHTLLFRRGPLLEAMPWSDQRPYLLDLDLYTRVLNLEKTFLFVRRETLGAFRVSSHSWSTRLIHAQIEQMRAWQQDYEARQTQVPINRMRARLAVISQVSARRAAYFWLRFRNDIA